MQIDLDTFWDALDRVPANHPHYHQIYKWRRDRRLPVAIQTLIELDEPFTALCLARRPQNRDNNYSG